jgi:hypothetical protein
MLTERQEEVLREMPPGRWVRPLDVGGSSGSHHSCTLAALFRKGQVERRQRGVGGPRGSWEYRRPQVDRPK